MPDTKPTDRADRRDDRAGLKRAENLRAKGRLS